MDEKTLKSQLAKGAMIVVVSSIILCAAVFGIFSYLYQVAHESEHKQMQIETKEYETRIMKEIDKNFQILSTLAKVYELSETIQSQEELVESLEAINEENSFVSLAYFTREGQGIRNGTRSGTMVLSLDDCDILLKTAIEQSMTGEKVVSKMFDNQFYGTKTIAYCVPVYRDGVVTGSLVASDTLEIFQDVADGNSVMGGNGYIHVLADDGEFLARSQNTIVTEDMSSIYDTSAISDGTKVKIRDVMEKREDLFGEMEYEGKKYHFYMEPLDYNGWYLFCVDIHWRSPLSLGRVVVIVACVFVVLLVLMLLLLYSSYREFRSNSKALLNLAYRDKLTQANNTTKFDQDFRLHEQEKDFSVVACNLHNFKGINDLFGRAQGDRVLRYLKSVIENSLKTGEFFCRDTADSFYIYLMDTEEETIRKRLEVISDTVQEDSMRDGDYSYGMSVYFGVAVRGDREMALTALQSIQNTRHTSVAFYNQNHHDMVRKKYSIEGQMHAALKNREFKLYLQPKFDLTTNALSGAEALVRWQNAEGHFYYPNEFIPLFENNGFCVNLDIYMLERACEQIRAWMDAGIEPIPISVNQSKLLFSNNHYPETISQLVARYNVPPAYITLEILEGTEAEDLEHLNAQITALHEKGFRISMDDFGNGYSSLNMLYQLRIDEMKLDRGFLRQVSEEDNARRLIMLRQIILFAKELGMTTVAEGIETQYDKDTMQSLSCDYGQGYFYEKPIGAPEFHEKYMRGRVKEAVCDM